MSIRSNCIELWDNYSETYINQKQVHILIYYKTKVFQPFRSITVIYENIPDSQDTLTT